MNRQLKELTNPRNLVRLGFNISVFYVEAILMAFYVPPVFSKLYSIGASEIQVLSFMLALFFVLIGQIFFLLPGSVMKKNG